MSKTLEVLAKRRAYLIEQCTQQRRIVSDCIVPLRRPLAIADGGITIFHYLKTHPFMLVGSGLVYAGYRFQSIGSWTKNAWFVLGLFSKIRQLFKPTNERFNAQ